MSEALTILLHLFSKCSVFCRRPLPGCLISLHEHPSKLYRTAIVGILCLNMLKGTIRREASQGDCSELGGFSLTAVVTFQR